MMIVTREAMADLLIPCRGQWRAPLGHPRAANPRSPVPVAMPASVKDEPSAALKKRRRFAEQMREQAQTIRPSVRQSIWLLALLDRICREQERARAKPRPRVADVGTAAPTSEELPRDNQDKSRNKQTLRDSARKRRDPPPKPTANNEEKIRWIEAVVTAQRRSARPVEQAAQPHLFTGEEARILVCLAVLYRSWRVKGSIDYDDPQSAAASSLPRTRRAWRHLRSSSPRAAPRPGRPATEARGAAAGFRA